MQSTLNFEPSQEESPEDTNQLTASVSTRKVHTYKPKINPQEIVKYYFNEKRYCQYAFSMPLIPQISYNPNNLLAQLQQCVQYTYKIIFLPQIKMLAVPNITEIKVENQQMHIKPNFQNESFDVPDIQCSEKKLYQIIQEIPQNIDFPYNIRLSTNKPVPQNHSLLDFTGLYGSVEEIKYQLIQEIEYDYNNDLQQNITIFEIFQKYLSHIFYFKPLNIAIDNRHSGNASRLLRFGLPIHKNVNSYLFATYINGCLRIQANAMEDLKKDQEILLTLQNCIFKQDSQLYKYLLLLCRYYYQMELKLEQKPWEQIEKTNEEVKDLAKQAYLLSLHQILAKQLLETITISQFIQLIQTDFIGEQIVDNNIDKLSDSILSIYYSPYYKAEQATEQMLEALIEKKEFSQKIVSLLYDQLTEKEFSERRFDREELGKIIYQITQNKYQQPKRITFQDYYSLINVIWLKQKYKKQDGINLMKKAKIAFQKQKDEAKQIQQQLSKLLEYEDDYDFKNIQLTEKKCAEIADFLIQCIKQNPYYSQQQQKAKKYDTQVIQLQMAHVGYMAQINHKPVNYNIPDYYQTSNINNTKQLLRRIFRGVKETQILEREEKYKREQPQQYESAIIQMTRIQQNEQEYEKLIDQALKQSQQYLQK